MNWFDAHDELAVKNAELREAARELAKALFADPRTTDADGPCWCRHVFDLHQPDCEAKRALYAKHAALLEGGAQ